MFGGRPSAETGSQSTEPLPYRLRDDVLSPGALAFYRVLVTSVDGTATVLTTVFDPAFDVTPARFAAIVTERGVIRHPLSEGLAQVWHHA